MQPTDPLRNLVELLEALARGQCDAELWERGAVAHYKSPAAESARISLVRASIESDAWEWPAVPSSITSAANALLIEAKGGAAWTA